MNTINILIPGKDSLEVKYASMAEVQIAVMKAGLGNITDKTQLEFNAKVTIEVPAETPKNRLSELQTVCTTFGFGGIVEDLDSEWEKGGIGTKADWTSEEAMKSRGVDISIPENVAKFQAVIKLFQDASEAWSEIKREGVVKVDGNFHIKKLKEFQVPRSKKDR